MANFYEKDNRVYLSFKGKNYKIIDAEDDNGGKELHCVDEDNFKSLFFYKNDMVRRVK